MVAVTGAVAGPGAVGVVGAGTMGAGIARVAARAGHPAYLYDARAGAAAAAAIMARGRDGTDVRALDRLEQLPACRLVIEAVAEDLAVKQSVLEAVAATQSGTTLLATNTSSLDVSDIAAGLPRPARVLGLHFFNPPTRMPLVEVVRGEQTSAETLAQATGLMQAWGKTPVGCASTPGFVVNRIARPFYGEAHRMAGWAGEPAVADPATLDAALRGAGFRMGPFELTDLIGQDVNLAATESIWERTGRDPRYEPTSFQRQLVAAGRLGRKTGRGVFSYAADPRPLDAHPDLRLAERLTAPGAPLMTDPVARTLTLLVAEAADLVARGDATAGDVDTAMRLGAAYPQGPIAWGRQIGHDVVRARLAELDRAFPGGRYRPCPSLA